MLFASINPRHIAVALIMLMISGGVYSEQANIPEAGDQSADKETVAQSAERPEIVAKTTQAEMPQTPAETSQQTETSPNDDVEKDQSNGGVDLLSTLPDHPYELMNEMTDILLKKLERFKTIETEAEKEEFAQQVVDQTFAILVDFDLIARRVMAKHYRYASPEQRARFALRFRQSLINTYALGMSAYSDQKIVIKPFEGIQDKGKRKRAKVEMEVVTSTGERYPIVYSLYETKEGPWKLENLVINSVNIGLTFRNQFNEALSTHAGNIDKVIETWDTQL